jgi:predicted Fe-S protein YdhL (DUF1289 family)
MDNNVADIINEAGLDNPEGITTADDTAAEPYVDGIRTSESDNPVDNEPAKDTEPEKNTEPVKDEKPEKSKPAEIKPWSDMTDEEKAQYTKGVQRRFDHQTKLQRQAERKAEAASKEAADLREQMKKYQSDQDKGSAKEQSVSTPDAKKSDVIPDVGEPPKLDDFDDHEAYITALAQHNQKQYDALMKKFPSMVEETARRIVDERDAARKETDTKTEREQAVDEFISEGAKKYGPDFEQYYNEYDLDEFATGLIVDTGKRYEFIDYLGRNPEVQAEIKAMTNTADVARKIISIEAEMSKGHAKAEKTKPKTITNAPPPPETVDSSGSSGSGIMHKTAREMDEYVAGLME